MANGDGVTGAFTIMQSKPLGHVQISHPTVLSKQTNLIPFTLYVCITITTRLKF